MAAPMGCAPRLGLRGVHLGCRFDVLAGLVFQVVLRALELNGDVLCEEREVCGVAGLDGEGRVEVVAEHEGSRTGTDAVLADVALVEVQIVARPRLGSGCRRPRPRRSRRRPEDAAPRPPAR